jgi:hypothetical protein
MLKPLALARKYVNLQSIKENLFSGKKENLGKKEKYT